MQADAPSPVRVNARAIRAAAERLAARRLALGYARHLLVQRVAGRAKFSAPLLLTNRAARLLTP